MFRKTAVAAGVAAAVIGAALTFNSAFGSIPSGEEAAAHFSRRGALRGPRSEAGAVSPRAASAATASPRHASISAGAVLPPTPSPAAASPDRASVSVASAALARSSMAGFGLAGNAGRFGHNFTPLRGATAFAPDSAWRGDRSWGERRGSWGEHRGWFARQGFHRG